MFKKVKKLLSNQKGALTTAELVILIAVVAVVATAVGKGLSTVFVGDGSGTTEDGGAVGQMGDFIKSQFDKAQGVDTTVTESGTN